MGGFIEGGNVAGADRGKTRRPYLRPHFVTGSAGREMQQCVGRLRESNAGTEKNGHVREHDCTRRRVT
jgi:hypothetical protein